MSILLAFKAFINAFRSPKETQLFLDGADRTDLPPPSHLHLLSLMQRSGRLIDFLKEDISSFSDAQIGAAARLVHKECAALLEELVAVRPILQEQEGSRVQVPANYDADSIKVVGNIQGNPPFQGTLLHAGWRAHKRSLPRVLGEQKSEILSPAEVEIT